MKNPGRSRKSHFPGVSPLALAAAMLAVAPGASAQDDVERNIAAPEGFVVELVYTVPKDQGSWVSITDDGAGGLIVSSQYGGMYRVTPGAAGTAPTDTRVVPIDSPVGGAQGLLVLGDDLYCMVAVGNRADGPGLYRLRDTDGDGTYDETKHLQRLETGGGHGPHAIVPGPDGMLYVVAGNHTPLPELAHSTLPTTWGEDLLLPRLWDARGHAVGKLAPGGWICRTDLDGETWELVTAGFRNTYDIAFNADGELFAYDADMEWDMGAPWYRPTRVNHAVSGADFGWRSGTGKWPVHYPDSLPAVVDIGPGSPTGVLFGTRANFPAKYRSAMFLLDWTFGTMYAIHMTRDGATYRGEREVFITGKPLPLADAAINPADGAMYFVVGGRRVASALYRVRYDGIIDDTIPGPDAVTGGQRTVRRELERLHRPAEDGTDVADLVWPHLGSDDRFIRYAARLALEHHPTDQWVERALGERRTRARLTALLAVARSADPTTQPALISALSSMRWERLERDERLEWLRVWALCFIRMGTPDDTVVRALARPFETVYPSGDHDIDRELCDMLVYLGSPVVVARTIALMERADDAPPEIDRDLLSRSDQYGGPILQMAAAAPQRQQVHYALSLRNAERGWTPELRERYFRWFAGAKRMRGGHSYTGFLDNIRKDALEHVPAADRPRLAAFGDGRDPLAPVDMATPVGPGRQWTVDEVVTLTSGGLTGRDYDNGKRMYAAASCIRCHRFAGTGSIGGPDLTALATRFSIRDLIEALVEPSRVISEQYAQTEFVLNNDRVIVGRIVGETDTAVTVMSSPLAPDAVFEMPLAMVAQRSVSSVSPMMPALLDALGPDEVRDLMAYLLSEGDPDNAMFKRD